MGVFSAGVPGIGVDAPEIVCLAVFRNDLKVDAMVLERFVAFVAVEILAGVSLVLSVSIFGLLVGVFCLFGCCNF